MTKSLLERAKETKPLRNKAGLKTNDKARQEKLELAVAYANGEITAHQAYQVLGGKNSRNIHNTLAAMVLTGIKHGDITIKINKKTK